MKRDDIKKLFPDATDEQIKAIMDLNGADINAAKGGVDELKNQLSAANKTIAGYEAGAKNTANADELKQALERATALETELNGLKLANQLRDIRDAVAKEKGVPAELLTGDSEDACRTQADAILAFAKPGAYPSLHDGGEAKTPTGGSTRDKFAAWAAENL